MGADDEDAVSSATRAALEALQHGSPSKKAQKRSKVSLMICAMSVLSPLLMAEQHGTAGTGCFVCSKAWSL